jgi:cation transport ATPase
MAWGKLGIVAGVYLGTRLTSRQSRSKIRSLRTPAKQPPTAVHAVEQANATSAATSRHPFLGASALSLATTSAGYLLFPATLGPISLALLSYSATPMLLRAERHLRQSPAGTSPRLDKDSYSALVSGLCLAGGQWGAAAVFNTLYHFSEKAARSGQQRIAQRSAALYSAHKPAGTTWVSRDGMEVPLPANRIRVGEILVISAGEMAPVDGLVVQGEGTIDAIDEQGKVGIARISSGATLPMAALLLEGRLEVKALRSGAECEARRADSIRQRIEAHQHKLQDYAVNWANRAPLPFLGLAALAWPLFGTAPALGLLFSVPVASNQALLSLHTANHLQWALDGGAIFREPQALERLGRIDALVFDGSKWLEADQTEALQTLAELRERGVRKILLIGNEPREHGQAVADALGITDIHWTSDTRRKTDIVEQLRDQGHRVAYAGDRLDGLLALKAADVSICSTQAEDYIAESADILLFNDRLGAIVRAMDSARSLPIQQTAEIGSWGTFAFINTLFVAFLRFSPLQSSLLSGIVFGLEYRQATRLPKRLREAAERQRQNRSDAKSNTIEGTAQVVRQGA